MKTIKGIRADGWSHGGGGGPRTGGPPGDYGSPGHFIGFSRLCQPQTLFPSPHSSCHCQPFAICNRYNVLARCGECRVQPQKKEAPLKGACFCFSCWPKFSWLFFNHKFKVSLSYINCQKKKKDIPYNPAILLLRLSQKNVESRTDY